MYGVRSLVLKGSALVLTEEGTPVFAPCIDDIEGHSLREREWIPLEHLIISK